MLFRRTLVVGFLGLAIPLVVGCSGATTGRGAIDPDAPDEYTTTESGLKYRILRKSDGKKPKSISHVRVHYDGTLDDGTTFDSTYARGTPAVFRLNEVVAGFTEGLQLIGEGGMIELDIPPELGYGENGRAPNIRPNSRLHFVVELIRVF
ncbi:MAG: FKBP-type peptidyl-prolyl cis-trans isomerase [Planctomycetales bacterium]|nr:FKBP-type peptidyl-prolyl cis-trans isomerase [Planctomycetales bacterium]